MGMIDIFPEAAELSMGALLFMMLVYGYILCRASETIGDGSEMLLLLYGPGIIGGLVIPILGAIPDCAVILISGLGSGTKEEIQNQLSVGVGTLVGSTVMLLTLPWAASVYLGRRDYDPVTNAAGVTANNRPKYTKFSLTNNCVTTLSDIPSTSKIMILASLSYFILQVPAFVFHNDSDGGASHEKPFALTGLIVTGIAFVLYCWSQVKGAKATEIARRLAEIARHDHWKRSLDRSLHEDQKQEMVFREHDKDKSGFIEAGELSAALASLGLKVGRRDVMEILKSIDTDNDNRISLDEFKAAVRLWVACGQQLENLKDSNMSRALKHAASHPHHHHHDSALLDSQEPLVSNESSPILSRVSSALRKKVATVSSPVAPVATSINGHDEESGYGSTQLANHASSAVAEPEDDEDDDCEEEEEEFWELSHGQLQMKAVCLLLVGTVICTIFSDPMVDCISELGARWSIKPFYISFVVTPMASNASEVIASLLFAKKKTNESISLTLATLHGAATMNSTLALCIFMALIYLRGLSWSYTAEVLTVVITVFLVGLNGLRRNIFLWQALYVGLLYPFAVLFIYLLENVAGLD